MLQEGRCAKGSDPAVPGARVELVGLPDQDDGSIDEARRARLPAVEVSYCDDDLVVVEKRAGVPAYPLAPGEGSSIAEALLATMPDLAGVGDLPGAPGLCHRLDLETSGLLLFARNDSSFAAIRAQFRRREVDKGYVAVVGGELRGSGEIDSPIGRRSSRRMVANPPVGTRSWPARTLWVSKAATQSMSLLSLTLVTGVTHQARVHLASIGHPILGDERYGGPSAPRLGLHASRLAFEHPRTGEPLDLSSRRAEDVVSLMAPSSD